MAFRRHMKNLVKKYSDAEVKVREATSNDPWGSSSSLMLEISDLTYNAVSLLEIMNMIWHRMNDHGKNWRHVYKSLTLLDYLIKNGSKKVIHHCREGFFNIQTLKDFHYIDEDGKDQGYHVREKSKQLIALLTDEQLLHNEREVARRTRRRTSYAMLVPKDATTKDYSPTMSVSEPISEPPGSENAQECFSKTAFVPQQNQPLPTPGKAIEAQRTKTLRIIAKKSSEDLIVFSEDEKTPTSTFLPPFPALNSSDERSPVVKSTVSDSWKQSVASYSSEISLSSSRKWSRSRSGDNTATNPVSTITLKPPSRKQSDANNPQTAKHFLDPWLSIPEAQAKTSQNTSKLDLLSSSSEDSVETIYLSPTFNTTDPMEDSRTNNDSLKSTPASSKQFPGPVTSTFNNFNTSISGNLQTASMTLHPSPKPDLTSSIATTTSFSTVSISSPKAVIPETTGHPYLTPSCGPSYLSSPQQPSSSVFLKDHKDRVTHPFPPCQISDEESENTSILNLLPDNSRGSAGKVNSFESRTLRISGGSWGIFPMQNKADMSDHFMPSAEGSSDVDTMQKVMVTLKEIKHAVFGLQGDVGNMAKELQTIGSQMAGVVSDVQHMSQFLTAPQNAKESLSQL
ncbi:PREDICTED: ENTH domain-containing protein 1 [Crocodylus porosus]|uniref:ENTH domain-containing protein 1 n=1 Tax=Crocodylus porosus TaxID=8502 RepID=UPI0009393195|nr:PREDICTED: ENTH domain-containing protein 1 [Crocodylus porosus]